MSDDAPLDAELAITPIRANQEGTKMREKLSRRTMLGGLVTAAPMLPREAIAANDASLLALGREFDAIAAAIDAATEDLSSPPAMMAALLERLSSLDAAIVAMPARTIEGFCVKARAASWALFGDLDPVDGSTTDRRMALSIIRDLIRLHAPKLENPGALKRLIEHRE